MKALKIFPILVVAGMLGALDGRSGLCASEPTVPAGPKVLFEEDPTLLTSTIEILVLTGAADDPAGKKGLTSMMAELLLRGTKSRSRTAFQSEIERMGASLAVRTSYDKIAFVGRVIKENTGAFMKLLQDAFLHPSFDSKELESLRTETLAEIANMKNSNGRLAGLALRRILFAGTPFDRSVDGALGSVKAIAREDLLKTYQENFNRGSFIFAVASPLKETELSRDIRDIWSAFPDGKPRERKSVALQVPKQPTLVVVQKPRTSTGNLMFGQAGITAQDPYRYSLGVGNYSFGGEPLVSRLFKVIRGELGWTYAIGSTYHGSGALTDQQGFFIVSSTPAIEYTSKTIFKVLTMWKEYRNAGLKSDEIRLAKESLVNSYPFEFDSAEKRLGQKLHSYLYHVPLLSPEEYTKTIQDVSNGKLKDAIKERQSEQGWLITLVADPEVIEKQLADEQAEVPADKRLTISRKMSPEELVE